MSACHLQFTGQHNDVIMLDLDSERVDRVNNKQSTVVDPELETYLAKKTCICQLLLTKRLRTSELNL